MENFFVHLLHSTPLQNFQEYLNLSISVDDSTTAISSSHMLLEKSQNELTSEILTTTMTLETTTLPSTTSSTTTTISTSSEMETFSTEPPFIEKCQIAYDNTSDRCRISCSDIDEEDLNTQIVHAIESNNEVSFVKS